MKLWTRWNQWLDRHHARIEATLINLTTYMIAALLVVDGLLLMLRLQETAWPAVVTTLFWLVVRLLILQR